MPGYMTAKLTTDQSDLVEAIASSGGQPLADMVEKMFLEGHDFDSVQRVVERGQIVRPWRIGRGV